MWWMQVCAIGGFLLFEGLTAFFWMQMRNQSTYVAVPAKVVASDIETSRSMSRNNRWMIMYAPHVRYEYIYQGQRHSSDSIQMGSWRSSDPDDAKGTLAKYPLGASVEAWVDPSKPSRAVLERGGWGWLLLGFGAGGLVWLAIWEGVNRAVFKRA